MFRFFLHNRERGERAGRRRRTERGAEYNLPGIAAQIFNDFAAAGDEATGTSERFGKATGNHIHPVGHAKLVAHAASLLAKNADAVRFIHHDRGVIFVSEIH